MEWISVKDRLPSFRGNCFVYVPDFKHMGILKQVGIEIGLWNGRTFIWSYSGIYANGIVTHWMPLPEPPKGE